MAVLGYSLLVVSVMVALLCLGHVWVQGLAHALGARGASPGERGRKWGWVAVIVVFGWVGAVTYWVMGCPRSA